MSVDSGEIHQDSIDNPLRTVAVPEDEDFDLEEFVEIKPSPTVAVFGADEITPIAIFLIHLAKPPHLNCQIALAERFSHPFAVKKTSVEYAILMLKGACIAYAGGFAEFRKVVFDYPER